MKKDYTYIAIVLDRSGSMERIHRPTVDGFNEFIKQQKALNLGTCEVELDRFDTEYEQMFVKALDQVEPITSIDPRGMTALNDAIGRTITSLGTKLASRNEADRPEKVIVVIMTDGGENASKEYTTEKVAELVKHQSEKYQWQFLYIGANQDAVLTAQTFNIPAGRAMTYAASAVGTSASYATVNSVVRGIRGSSTKTMGSVGVSDEDRKKAMEPDPQTTSK